MAFVKLKINFILLFCVNFLSGYAQEKLELLHADLVKGENTSIGNAIVAAGNVRFRQGSEEIFCQKVTWYKDRHETVFEQDVKFDDGNRIFQADKVFYHDLTRITQAIGNFTLIDSLHKLNAEKATYYETEEKIIADNNVFMTESKNEVELTGQHAEYWRNSEYALVTGSPILIKRDSTGKEELSVIGKKMELFEGGKRAEVIDSVKITHQRGRAYCNRAEYFKDDNRLLLKEEPIAWQGYDQMSGQEIELFFEKRELRKVIVTKQALVTSPVDTTQKNSQLNKLLGEKITLFIENSALKEVMVDGKATCYYHIFEKGEYKGNNKLIGDKITMNIEQGEIKRIIIESDPGSSSGTFYPPGFENQGS